MLRRASILKIIIQCLLRDINHTKSNSQIYLHYNINEVLKIYTAMKSQRNRYFLI